MSTSPYITASVRVARVLARVGGTAPRTAVIHAIEQDRGRRYAALAVEMALIEGRVVKAILPNGVLGLRLVDRDEHEAARA
ncbi:hypothetical protein FSW04_16225 [Baekduia soli]|uniref:Uncharacterized protein n=1 Tax=Baekduia soli TaxID=496014 RepID=A0A5B8U783_9ACTN|nr:hypothetical protein [Baekduia soli]QEC48966.1 hypothetical protein FSW04_16225 [Baekduia soli]